MQNVRQTTLQTTESVRQQCTLWHVIFGTMVLPGSRWVLLRASYSLGSADRPGSLLREAPYCKSCASSEGRARKQRGSCWEGARRICKGQTPLHAISLQETAAKSGYASRSSSSSERLRTPKHSSQLRLRVRFPSRVHWTG